ncbi:MAG: DUF115 domain-containing protein [Pseudomonadales bacterium]|nr:DUF115 domain-containing protein [Pseudomonadales bacterium]
MAELHPAFHLQHISMGNPGDIYWEGCKVTSTSPLTALTNKHIGKSAFIIASGPSLKDVDLKLIDQHITFCVNGSYLKCEAAGLKPDYAVICDANFVVDRWAIVAKILSSGAHCLFTPTVLNHICQTNPAALQSSKISVIQTHFRHYAQTALEPEQVLKLSQQDKDLLTNDGRIGFSLNPLKGLFSAHTVTHLPVQLCWFFGIKQVFILGMDLTDGIVPIRFYEQGHTATPSHLDRDYQRHIEPAFKIIGEMRQSHNFSVYNLSAQSRLPDEIIPKISLEKALEMA